MATQASGPNTPILSGKTVGEKRLTFQALLANELDAPYTLAAFEEFLRVREHSEENLEFLNAIKAYRATGGPWDSAEAKAAVATIVQTYVNPGSPKEVNCPNIVRKKLLEDVQAAGMTDPDVFTAAENKTLELMRLSSFPHFVRWIEGKANSPQDRVQGAGAQ
ncbi:RGS domain-containing protein [Blastocladiella britannica]|nr:RGS domain-containing protein [Blastocladiella britannica]